nr:hypothetical protein [uncultured Capnocytophaga sp.]
MKKTIVIVLSALLLLSSITYYIITQHQKQQAQEVYKLVHQNLLMLSKEYNKGVQKMYYLKKFDEAKNKIVKKPN